MYKNWKIKKSDLLNVELQESLFREQEAVANWCNQNQQYRINDDEEYIFVESIPAPTEEALREQEIAELKAYLVQTDYAVIKIAEGVATAEEYAEVLDERRQARIRINELTEPSE